ncbi:hypothetical protein STEG23_036429, partial [Scotinomys teguina]
VMGPALPSSCCCGFRILMNYNLEFAVGISGVGFLSCNGYFLPEAWCWILLAIVNMEATKLNQLEKAMEAAHTFFMANPEHMEIQQDIEDYRVTAGMEAFQLVDREARPHLESYNAGVKHYEADDFEAAIKYFEQALREYFNEDMECRALCEGPQRFEEYEYLGYKGGLYEAIAVGEYVKALECAKAYLMFHPGDEDVLDNVDYYESLLDDSIDPESIEAREDLTAFFNRHNHESELIKSAAEGLGFLYSEPNYWISYGGRQDENR